MVNIVDLKRGDLVISKITNTNGLTAGQAYQVIKAGFSGWDNAHYADIETDYKDHTIGINRNNFRDFDKV